MILSNRVWRLPVWPLLAGALLVSCASPQAQSSSEVSVSPENLKPLNHPPEYWKPFVSAEAYEVLFQEATERPFSCALNEEHREGTFVCAASNLPIFTSDTKFDSGTGWPSFNAPIEGHLGFSRDMTLGIERVEYHCVRCGGHMGHVFDDGPPPTGRRWCTNGVAMTFIPKGEPLPALRS